MTDTVFLETRFQILSGTYSPGGVLDREQIAALHSCSQSVVLDALSTLLAEGYLYSPKRGVFAVRLWDIDELEDYYDLWGTLAGVAAARAAERGEIDELSSLAKILTRAHEFDFTHPDSSERYITEYARFTARLIKLSRAAPLLTMAHLMVPNYLFRQAMWLSTANDLLEDRLALTNVADHLLKRSSVYVKEELRRIIIRTLSAVKEVVREGGSPIEPIAISRPDVPFAERGVFYDLGGREPSFDGVIVPYGITAGR